MLKPQGYSPSLYLGLSVSAENLLKAILIQSTNDAAEALSYFIGKEEFLALMNQKAKELNMINTVFYDPHGLNPANRSTAQDLIKLLTYIYKNHPEILDISRNNNFWLPDSTGKLLKFRNLNAFYRAFSICAIGLTSSKRRWPCSAWLTCWFAGGCSGAIGAPWRAMAFCCCG